MRAQPVGTRDGVSSSGFSLIEVVTALAVVSILLIPLVGLFLDAVHRVEDEALAAAADRVAVGPHAAAVSDIWAWWPGSVEDATWEADGLRLRLRVPRSPEQSEVGWWVDGWLAGCVPVASQSPERLTLTALGGVPPGSEIVVRVRTGGRPWGVPWRTSAPGRLLSAQETGNVLGGLVDERAGPVAVVVHGRAAGVSLIRTVPEWTGPVGGGQTWPSVVLSEPGMLEVECDGRTQSLEVGSTGVVHLYF